MGAMIPPRGIRHLVVLLASGVGIACATSAQRAGPAALDASAAAAITDSVRTFAADLARGVTHDGPGAWRAYFAATPAFFMASEGRLVFPSSDSAGRAIQTLERTIAHIELRWGDGLRVDPLAPGLAVLAAPYHEVRVDRAGHQVDETGFFTGLAEHRGGAWRLRNAHWSVATPPPPVP